MKADNYEKNLRCTNSMSDKTKDHGMIAKPCSAVVEVEERGPVIVSRCEL